jgi:hypothetical protein
LHLPGYVSAVSAVLCLPKYSITRRLVTTSRGNLTGGDVLEISSDVLEDMALGIAPSALTYDILGSMWGYLSLTGAVVNQDPLWLGLMNLTMPQPEWKAFANATLLSTAFQRTFRTIAAITVKYTKTVPAAENQSVPGRITYRTPRLVVATASLRAVEALLAALTLVALLLCLYNFKALAKRTPSLMTTAAVLATSDRLAHILCPDQVPTLDTLAKHLGGYLFSSSQDLRTIHVQEDPQFDDLQLAQRKASLSDGLGIPVSKSWRPAAATKTFRVLLIAATLILFVALEVVYQISNKHGGIAEVATEGYTQYLWLYLPALAMAGLGLAYGSMDIAARILHPFSELSRGNAGKSVMQFDPRSSTALVAVAQTLRRRFYGLSAIIATSFLAALLTVAASGLYSTIESAPRIESVGMSLESWFDLESPPIGEPIDGLDVRGHSALISEAIYLGNMSYPAGAYGEFAFAIPDISGLEVYSSSKPPATLRTRIPAAQSQANCSLYRFWDSIQLQPNQSSYSFKLEVTPPPGCRRGPTQALSDDRYLSLADSAGQTPPPGYFGFISGLWWKLLPEAFDSSDGSYTPDNRTPYTVCSDDTQHLFMIYGHRIDLTMHNVSLLHCLPFVQAVELEAEVTLPALFQRFPHLALTGNVNDLEPQRSLIGTDVTALPFVLHPTP